MNQIDQDMEVKSPEKTHSSSTTIAGYVMLAAELNMIFFVGLLPVHMQPIAFVISFSLLFVVTLFITRRIRKRLIYLVIGVMLVQWTSFFLDIDILYSITQALIIILFFYIVGFLVIQLASAHEVTMRVILEAVNAYLLLGIAFAIVLALVHQQYPEAFAFSYPSSDYTLSTFLYYSFVTLTTLGYGDIVPVNPVARAVSVFISVSGQLYLTVILALLVGKYLATK